MPIIASIVRWSCATGVVLVAGCASGPGVTTPSGLWYEVLSEGTGPAAEVGQTVRIHETMALEDGTVLYTTHAKNNPVKFKIGAKQAIDGLDEAVRGMRLGEHRKAVVPPSLSKRSGYPPNVPPDATLYYDIELVEIIPQ